ncbi:MAG: sigma-54-dependent Fis family transcriptional regulator [Polyangiaceae bacterium]|nr:sigma-54-dependent Fis family transcriptional regulator [Polyangiaceae bacterium]
MATSPAGQRVLVVDDEPSLREMLSIALKRAGYEVVIEAGVRAAAERLKTTLTPFPLVISDLVMPDGSGMEVLQTAKARSPSTEVIIMTAHSTVEGAIEAMRAGAYDFIVKPFSPRHMLAQAEKAIEKHALFSENQRLKAQLQRIGGQDLDLGASPAMATVATMIDRVATTRTTVLITGESGTGKEGVARLLHTRSDRAGKPFRVVNCGALPEALMESELFGHEKGAFTGATATRPGLFREADGGTLLLDEVGELPLALQVKLLRVLQEKRVRAVGADDEKPVDVRVLAATNREIEAEVKAGRFRQDLYYRLNIIRIHLPPLRDRAGDVSRLAEKFFRRFADEMGKDVRSLSADALRALDRYSFPGNVRELENLMERAVALATGSAIGLGDLPPEISGIASLPTPLVGADLPPEGAMLDEVLGEIERRMILQALERTQGVRKAAAKLLGITFRSMRYRLEKHGLDVGDGADEDAARETSPASSDR